MTDNTEFHYRVVFEDGKEKWIWAIDALNAGYQALLVEESDRTISFVKECEHECPDLEDDDEGII